MYVEKPTGVEKPSGRLRVMRGEKKRHRSFKWRELLQNRVRNLLKHKVRARSIGPGA